MLKVWILSLTYRKKKVNFVKKNLIFGADFFRVVAIFSSRASTDIWVADERAIILLSKR